MAPISLETVANNLESPAELLDFRLQASLRPRQTILGWLDCAMPQQFRKEIYENAVIPIDNELAASRLCGGTWLMTFHEFSHIC